MEEKNLSKGVNENIQPQPTESVVNKTEPTTSTKSNISTVNKTKYFTIDRKDGIFVCLFVLACIIFSSFALWGGFKAGFGVSAILNFALITIYLFEKNTKIKTFPLICGILSCVTSLIFFCTSNEAVRFFGIIAIPMLSYVWFISLANKNVPSGDLGLIKGLFCTFLLGTLEEIPKNIGSFFAVKNKRTKTISRVLIGVVLAIPVLVIVVPLLISSDAAFSGFTNNLFEESSSTIAKVIVGLIITPILVSFCIWIKKSEEEKTRGMNINGIENTIVISFLSVISLCYLMYLFSQLAYFFSAFNGFLPEGYSFNVSEYARRGFFELSVISVINFIIIYTVLLLSRKEKGKICIASRVLCLFISVFTLIITSTALSKMFLYIKSFGMTKLRVTTSAFMIFLGVVFISFILRLYSPKVKVLQVALVTASVVLILLGGFNVNKIVAEYNYQAYKNGTLDTIDVYTIYELGDEGVPYLVKLANDESFEVSENSNILLKKVIKEKYYEWIYSKGVIMVKDRKYNDFSEYNIPLNEAYSALEEYIVGHPKDVKFMTEE